MFKEFFTKEIGAALRSPMIYIFFFLMALMAGAAVASDSIIIGGAIGNTNKNAPHIITNFVLILGIFSLLIAAAFFNNAALRDSKNQFQEIMFSLPITKSGYFWGRFLGALVLSTIPLLGIFLGVEVGAILAKMFEWVDAERFGSFQLAVLVNNYVLFILPNMFIAGSIIFFLAHKWQNTIISFVGVLVIIVAYLVTSDLMSDLENEQLGALLDIFGIGTYSIFTKYWTPVEKNTLAPPIAGLLLYNRLIWLSVGVAVSAISYQVFNLKLRQAGKKSKSETKEIAPVSEIISKPSVSAQFNFATNWTHFMSFFKLNFLNIVKSNVFKILVVFSLVLLFVSMIEGYEYFGLQSYPLTYKVVGDITSSTGLFTIIIVIFFAGELVWRDRTERINEVINSTPHQSFASVFAQFFALLSVATLLHVIYVFIGISSQLLRGFTDIKFEVYVIDYFVDLFPNWFLFIALFMFIQTLLSNRYIGYFVSILVFMIWGLLLSILDIQSNMLDLGGGPSIRYSDMSGFGSGFTGALWFNLYWMLLAVIMLFKASFYWPRTAANGFSHRIKSAFSNATPTALKVFGAICVLWLLVATNVFYNTQILNSYITGDEQEELLANYEKKYKKYQHAPHPTITDVIYYIDIYPEERDIRTKSELQLINKTNHPIDSMHFIVSDDWETNIDIAGAKLVLNDEEIGYQIYELAKPIQPGASMEMTIVNNYITTGFENDAGNTSIQKNGTFINNSTILPNMGYSPDYELGEKYTRKKYDLEPKDRMPRLVHSCGDMCNVNYLSDGRSDWVNVETFISTSEDQIAIAPGSLLAERNENGRNYYHYKVDHISQNFFSFMSAEYEVSRSKYKDVDIEIYYDEDHPYNVNKMTDAVERSLAYYEKNFGPYFHKQARIIEFPRYATFAQAFPGTMPYSESFGFITNLEDESENNVVDAVIAHEMAHQWWAHQEISAKMEGGTFLTESFAEYSSLMVMKEAAKEDPIKMKNFLKYDFNRYLRGRSGEREKELPLYRVENQSYIHYGKGAIVLYALQDYIGEDSLNAALSSFLEEYRYAEPPYPNSHDFLRHLYPRVPDSLNYLVDDWIKNIRLYDLRLTDAQTISNNSGYETTMKLELKKLDADSLGTETEMEFEDWIDIGLYADNEEENLLIVERVKLNQKDSTITLFSKELPKKAAIDPKRLLIERVTDDNVKTVELKGSTEE